MAEADEIALDIKGDREGGLSVILGDATDMAGETLLTVEDALFLATGVRIRAETLVPPFGANIIEEMMDDAVAERCGDNLAGDGVVYDESDAAARSIIAAQDAVA